MQQASAATCAKCSSELPSGAIFCPRCGTPTPPTISGAGAMEYTPPAADADAQRQQELQRLLGDSCELRGLLGRGGFADVIEAWDPRLKRSLAVKTLRTDLVASVALVERFRREAEAIAQLRHPNVIPIYSVGGEGSIGYFVMPKVEGESLATRLAREGQLSVQESCRILREAASALSAAHRVGIIHRDIKPENILLDGPDRRVLVMDFGIAKSIDAEEKGLTGTGMLVGTPQYMSPEQAAGDRVIDNRSDQYALATVGYRMLTGQLPFDGESVQTVIFKQVTEPPRPIVEIAPVVPAAIATVIERALAKRPADRFESMDAFGSALEKAQQESAAVKSGRARVLPLAARIEAMRRELPRWRQPLTIVAIIATIVAFVLGPRTVYRSAYQLAAHRDDAVFAAKSFLAGRGITASLGHYAEFRVRDTLSVYRYLLETVGGRAVEQQVASGIPLWSWRTNLKPEGKNPSWIVELGKGNRVVGFSRQISDTTLGARLSSDSAEKIATRELSARGGTSANLRRLADSVVTRPNRIDHIFRWALTDRAIPWTGADTAFGMVSVRVSGTDVTGFAEHLETPARYQQQHNMLQGAAVFGLVIVLLVLAGLATGIGILIARSRKDELQWGVGLIIALAVCALYVPNFFLTNVAKVVITAADSDTPVAVMVITTVAGAGFVFFIIFLGSVLAESLSAEHRPALFGGVADLTRGRFVTPELVSAAANGATSGVVVAAVLKLISFASLTVSGYPTSMTAPELVAASVPAAEVLNTLGDAATLTLMLGVLQLVLYHLRRSATIAVVGAILVIAVISFSVPDRLMANRVNALAEFVLLILILWRFGFLAAVFANFTYELLLPLYALFWNGASGGLAGSLLAVAVFLLPFALAAVAYRRLKTTPQTALRFTSG